MKTPRFSLTRRVTAPPGALWALLTDTDSWPVWGPAVSAVECADAVIGLGSTGRVRTPWGVWLPFEVTEHVSPPVARWAWRIGPLPATAHQVMADPARPGGSIVTVEVPAWAVACAPMCLAALAGIDALTRDPDAGTGVADRADSADGSR